MLLVTINTQQWKREIGERKSRERERFVKTISYIAMTEVQAYIQCSATNSVGDK